MPTIRVLPDLLINKIAAGEVIERPASVVKELLENALDAGATRIDVVISDGGRKLISISDNGCGIPADQLPLAVTPHATSKLGDEDDLFSIATLGFRGEALASIGSVAHLHIVSRPADEVAGAEIHVAGEQITSSGAAGAAPGTTIEIRDLFFNVPARRKFLKNSAAETGHITEQLARVALPHAHVAMSLKSENRMLKRLGACTDTRQRIADFYGDELAESLIPVSGQQQGMTLSGYVAPPASSRNTGKWQYFFVNQRFIRDRTVLHAIKDSFRGLMEPARFPVAFLFLTVDPARIDVNVHPTKIEVRWQDTQAVHRLIRHALRAALGTADLVPTFDVRRGSPPAGLPGAVPRPVSTGGSMASAGAPFPAFEMPTPRPDVDSFFTRKAPPPSRNLDDATAPPRLPLEPEPPQAIQLHNTYLVTETEDGILIIDQHALHERVIYEQLNARMASGKLESQNLLIPETVDLSDEQIAALEGQPELLERLGIDCARFDARSLGVHAFPAMLGPEIIGAFMRDLADAVSRNDSAPTVENLIHKAMDMMACKAAVKAGDPLTEQERRSLIAQRHLVDKSTNCPHGRPTALRFTLADLERQFKRR